MIYEALLLSSEVILSAYPLLIKLVDASIPFQTGLRMILFAVLAATGAFLSGSPIVAANLVSVETFATGLLNLLHVGSSYTAFDQLTAGNAMALFYTYPVWNVLGAAAVYGESVSLRSVPWIGLGMLGAILLAQPSLTQWTLVGVVSALMAALTETGIYLWFRSKNTDAPHEDTQPWTKMIQMYGSSAVLWAIGLAAALAIGALTMRSTFRVSGAGLAGILGFNTFVGFMGYALRFYIIPRVSTIAFSAVSFFGIVSAYVLGWLFMGEQASWTQLAGAAAIIASNAVLLRRGL